MSSVHLQKPAFIVFEGLDGSGKSTCARLLADTIDAEYLTTPSPDLRAYREDVIASFAGCQEANQLFYLATVFATSANARDLIGEGRPVVLDRYFLSTQAYAAFRGTVLDLDQVAKDLLPADITVFLDCLIPRSLDHFVPRSVDSRSAQREGIICRARHGQGQARWASATPLTAAALDQ